MGISIYVILGIFLIGMSEASFGGNVHEGTVFYDPMMEDFLFRDYIDTSGAAWGFYNDSLNDKGFGELHISTTGSNSDWIQMKAAGYLEGVLTQSRIFEHRTNLFKFYLTHYLNNASDFSPAVYKFLEDNYAWTLEQVEEKNKYVPFWEIASLNMNQFFGLVEGYNSVAPSKESLNETAFWVYQSAGDLLDLTEAIQFQEDRNVPMWWHTSDSQEFHHQWTLRNQCSGMVKMLADFSEVFISQTAWFMYGAMNKIMKTYNFSLSNENVFGQVVSFSSYPGILISWDDFYIMDSGLVAIETTFSIFNETLFEKLTPQTLLDWQRVGIANKMAWDSKSWADIFATDNSGTYNNQWLIIDYNKFEPLNAPKPGFLWILEQIPGAAEHHDMTDTLIKDLYYPSYNVPSFPKVLDICNYTATIKAQGPSGAFWLDPDHCCRANIFRRDHVGIKTIDDMKYVMKYNRWEADPLSVDPVYGPDPGASIASRYDLRDPNKFAKALPFGALDSKIASHKTASKMSFWTQAGPTNDDQPTFKFSTCPFPVPHTGLPDEYNFDWYLYENGYF